LTSPQSPPRRGRLSPPDSYREGEEVISKGKVIRVRSLDFQYFLQANPCSMKRLLIIIICLHLASLFFHIPGNKSLCIIDTDAGIDDIRAIAMLLASPDVRVLAITVSPGL